MPEVEPTTRHPNARRSRVKTLLAASALSAVSCVGFGVLAYTLENGAEQKAKIDHPGAGYDPSYTGTGERPVLGDLLISLAAAGHFFSGVAFCFTLVAAPDYLRGNFEPLANDPNSIS